MYNVIIYSNTGFNATNIPDGPSTLAASVGQAFPALDIYQARELSRFKIKATYNDVKNADYLKLENPDDATDFAYYSIDRATMVGMDVAVLDVTMDYIMTAGGVANLQFLDGMCERHHVAVADDIFGKYTEADPYLTPAETMELDVPNLNFKESGETDEAITIIESTVDLYQMYLDASTQGSNPKAIDYLSDDQNVVTVPSVYPTTVAFATAIMHNVPSPSGPSDYYETNLPEVNYFIPDATSLPNGTGQTVGWTQQALAYLRSLGVESCIIAQYAIPQFMIKDTSFLARGVGQVGALKGACKKIDLSTNLPFLVPYTHTVHNKRLFYGNNCKYYIASIASGNKAEFLPEELYDATNAATAPTLEMRVDPRAEGCPYFRFEYYRHDNSTNLFFTNAVKGLPWQNVPLVYRSASGSMLNQYRFNAAQAIRDEAYDYDSNLLYANASKNAIDNYFGMLGDLAGGVGSLFTGQFGQFGKFVGDGLSTYMDDTINTAMYEFNSQDLKYKYNLNKNSELQNLLIQNNVVAPSMNFPISESIRDFVGNTCIVYRTKYTENDVARLDQILSMYGYRHTTKLTPALLTNRSKFNYIQAYNVSVKNTNIPAWIREGIAAQLSVGCRIWHQLPDPNAYTDGTNI